jgi:diguanylate cyclase (GGDEF)-like protein/PAS domain S-box-containing protein
LSDRHRLLQRQLRRLGLDESRPPDAAQWVELLTRVSTAYGEADQARYIGERALALSSEEMRELHDELHTSQARLTAVFDAVDVGLCVVSASGVVETVNPTLALASDRSAADIEGRALWDVVSVYAPEDHARHHVIVDDVLLQLIVTSRVSWRCDDVVVDLGNAMVFPATSAITPLVVDDHAIGAVMVVQDITARKQAEANVAWQATHDPLTGLPNRSHFMDLLDNALSRRDRQLAVIYCDLDHFKQVNDTHGHAAGDELLARVAGRLRDAVRDDDVVARLSGDEFVILAHADALAAASIATRVVSSIAEPFALHAGFDDGIVDGAVTVSVGVAVATPWSTPAQMLRDADLAMYDAKQAGRSRVHLFGAPAELTTPADRAARRR